MEDEELVLNIPNKEKLPCLTCKWGMHNFLATYCVKYAKKPDDVYYANKDCEHYEPINK